MSGHVQRSDDLLMLTPLHELQDKLDDEEELNQLERWLMRQESSILHAMEQTRIMSVEAQPYWIL